MRRPLLWSVLVLLASLLGLSLGSPAASARRRTVAPPGYSAVSQYVEDVPTAKGGRPTTTIHPGGSGSGGSGGSSAGGGHGGVGVSRRTERALLKLGANGASAAAFAGATAPGGSQPPAEGRRRSSGAATTGSPALASLVNAATGSSSGGGMGAILPVLLLFVALGATALRLRHRRAG